MARSDFIMTDLGLEKQDSKIPLAFTGQVKDYYTVINVNDVRYGPGRFHIRIGLGNDGEDYSHEIDEIIAEIRGKYNPATVSLDLNYLEIAGNIPLRKKKFNELVTGITTYAVSRLNELNIPTGDFLNGHMDETVSLYHVDSAYLFLSDESYQQIQEDVALKNESGPEKSIQAGIGGAILGSIIGAVIWAVLLYFGFYAWFAGIIGTYFAFKFYRKNNGLLSRTGIVTVVGIVISILLLTNYLVYALFISLGLQDFGFTYFMVLTNLMTILRELQLMTPFMIDLFLGVGITGIYGATYAYRLYHSTKNDGNIRKL